MYFAFEESESEIVRNMASVGMDLGQWVDAGLLQFHSYRPSFLGLEAHLFSTQRSVREFRPSLVVQDPISDLLRVATAGEVSSMLTRLVDFLKANGVTSVFTSLSSGSDTDLQMTSLVDTWLLVTATEGNGERNRLLSVLKSRGMAHSNQIREFLLTNHGIELADVYVGPEGALTGSARQAQEASELAERTVRHDDLEQHRRDLERRRQSVEAETATLWRSFDDEAALVGHLLSHGTTGVENRADQRAEQGRLRRADRDGFEGEAPTGEGAP